MVLRASAKHIHCLPLSQESFLSMAIEQRRWGNPRLSKPAGRLLFITVASPFSFEVTADA